MHQHPRTPPPTASPASSPWTNPARTNNPRDRTREGHSRAASDAGLYSERGAGQATGDAGPATPSPNQTKETKAKLNQIIQNYFTKAAQIIIQSRMEVPPVYARGTDTKKVNKWFNVELDETDAFREELRLWRMCDADGPRPPSLILETFLDTAALTNKQTLVIIDDQGKRWNVAEALNASDSSDERGNSKRKTEVILERWRIELGEPLMDLPSDLASILPTVYKKSIVLFRSLYTYSRFLPAWKFEKRLAKLKLNHSAHRVNCRIINGDNFVVSSKCDGLNTPLFEDTGSVAEEFSFGTIDSPAGPFTVKVSYRTNCEFRVDDSEALLSSHFINLDEHYFRPSLGARDDQLSGYFANEKEVGSLPVTRRDLEDRPDRSQAYGSLSTFHHVAPPTSSSPLSALRAARELGSDSPSTSPPLKTLPSVHAAQGTKAPTRPSEGTPQRRPSVSFQPFKAPSLSASPATPDQAPSSPRNSGGRFPPPSIATQARNRTSAGQQSPSFSRGSPVPPENAMASSASGSPKAAPISRYSSSFTHRRAKLSSGGTSKTDDDNNSSGKGSLASSTAQPGSGMLMEGGQGGSSGSVQTDDDNISDFLKLLDKQKNLKSFEVPSDAASADASARRPGAALYKFQKMRDSNAALSDSMSSSLLLHRSSTSSSRQLSSVPPMVAGTSTSASSSPGKPISPHTPHTPAIPSRLSANSIAEYSSQPSRFQNSLYRQESDHDRESTSDETTQQLGNTAPLDIPTSPRPFPPHNRRSSSVSPGARPLTVEDDTNDIFPFGMRSASMGNDPPALDDDRPPLNLSTLLRLREASEPTMPAPERRKRTLQPAANLEDNGSPMTRQRSTSSVESRDDGTQLPRGSTTGSTSSPYRPRIPGGSGGRGYTPPHTSYSSDKFSTSGTSERPPARGRYSFPRTSGNVEEEEPLLFAMSELGHQSRRSLEEGRQGSGGGGNTGPGGGDSAPMTSKRGSRQGGTDSGRNVW